MRQPWRRFAQNIAWFALVVAIVVILQNLFVLVKQLWENLMIWSKYGPIVCWLDFSRWSGGWGDAIRFVDYSYVVLPRET